SGQPLSVHLSFVPRRVIEGKPMKMLALSCLLALSRVQDPVKDRLEKSPRHHEWVELKVGDRTLHAFVVFPEVKEKAAAIVVIHENKGLNDWARSAADQFAEAGLIAIAPDLLSGLGPNGGGHGFMRAGEMPGAKADDQKARADAWVRLKELLKKL